ncbi:hypothetical protein D9757_006782 [Collybiopsis confluens]|uniref:Proline dehydrogenase n=1 Tax=Collybiopsis confluens TaxID=2823264 RepID=A0A8H5HLJ8_9AGAR|nr:hypothetical protein D9757_006782 [Collybiopsis confluens]
MLALTRKAVLHPIPSASHVIILGRRHLSCQARSPGHRRLFGGAIALAGAGLGTVGLLSSLLTDHTIQADTDLLNSPLQPNLGPQSEITPLRNLIRAYVVYTMCSFPSLVDASPNLLNAFMGIPVVRSVTEAFVRATFFGQFVGGDTAQGSLSLLHSLRERNKGALFAYSIEVDESEATSSSSAKQKGQPVYKRCIDEMVRSIDVAAEFEDTVVGKESGTGRRTWVAIKMTALLPDAQSLIALSSHIIATRPKHHPAVPFPGCPRSSDLSILDDVAPNSRFLSDKDIAALRELYADLRRISNRAQDKGVKLIIDAEYSWYQPAIDAMQLALMREFNKIHTAPSKDDLSQPAVQPLIYGTFQAYLRRTPLHLTQSYLDAKEHDYALGVKLVRGAYHPHEVAAHEVAHQSQQGAHFKSLSISPESLPPVWQTKNETDKCYNECAKMLVGWVSDDIVASTPKARKAPSGNQHVGVLFGTHNWTSVKLILNELVERGLARPTAMTTSLETTTEGEGGDAVLRIDNDVTERVTLGQLFGMSDALTDYIARRTISNTPMVIKYVPYGALSEVMPYLSRRAVENKSVLGDGHADEERSRAGREIWKRVTRVFG